jgi:hypothetical protein
MACQGSYYINVAGTVQQQCNPVLAAGLRVAGFVGPFNTVAEAKARQTVSGATNAVASSLGLPSLTNTRSFMVRAVKVIVGVGLIITGLTMLVKKETNISLGDVAKVAAI